MSGRQESSLFSSRIFLGSLLPGYSLSFYAVAREIRGRSRPSCHCPRRLLPPPPLATDRYLSSAIGCCAWDGLPVCMLSSSLPPYALSRHFLTSPLHTYLLFSQNRTTPEMSDTTSNKESAAMLWASFVDEAEGQPAVMPLLDDAQAATLTCLRCGHDEFQTPGCKGWGKR